MTREIDLTRGSALSILHARGAPHERHAPARERILRPAGLSGEQARACIGFEVLRMHGHRADEDERRALGPVIQTAMPGVNGTDIASFTQMPSSTYCQVSAMVDNETWLYRRAFAVVRAEHPDLMHLSCLHEEITQGLGLPNDSPRARPSIYNDDQEFALMTPMDEMMLRMLYDRRLRPGMSVAEARPIVQQIALEMTGGDT